MTNRIGAGIVVGLAILAVGCGGSVRATGPFDTCTMPPGGNFSGKWTTNLGRLSMTQDGTVLTGTWEDPVARKSGRIEGSVDGCLALFSWNQTDDMIPGRPRTTSGRGVFRYVPPPSDHPDGSPTFDGVWGYGSDTEGGGSWTGRRTARE